MPIAISFVDEERGVVYTASGVLTGAEAVAAVRQVNSRDLSANPVLYTFVDCGAISGFEISQAQMYEIVDIITEAARKQAPVTRVCPVYAKDDLPFGLFRMHWGLSAGSGWEAQVFRDRGQAIAWTKQRVAALHGVTITVE